MKLHWKILLGMILGLITGYLLKVNGFSEIIIHWIKPWGVMFLNALKMIAVPLIIVSLITGIAELKDISKLSKMGLKTITFFLISTAIAVSIGLFCVNIIKSGAFISSQASEKLMADFSSDAQQKIISAQNQQSTGPLQMLVDIIPDNIFKATTDNGSMLKVIFFSLFLGIGLVLIDPAKSKPVISFFSGLNEVILKMIDIIMLFSPIGVFALLAGLMVEIPDFSMLKGLIMYAITVLIGLSTLLFIVYPTAFWTFTKYHPKRLFKALLPAQLVAFSTSSSAATLPVTLERTTEHLGVDEEVSGFVLPLGATVNMDGTALYQAVAAVFIAQVLGIELSTSQQLMIVVTATLASIGSAAVPSAGMVMLVIVLGQLGIPEAGLALIFAIDRPLDMFRTVINVSSDATAASIIAHSEGKLKNPHVKNLDDFYKI